MPAWCLHTHLWCRLLLPRHLRAWVAIQAQHHAHHCAHERQQRLPQGEGAQDRTKKKDCGKRL